MDYLDFLRRVHAVVRPQRYLEVGVRWGHSLSVARCATIAIDPAFSITQELSAEVHLYRTTSDEYFSRPDPLGPVGGQGFDLCFIDGMHLFEFALRDFIVAERHSRRTGVIIFDDILPRSVEEAARVRTTSAWTGDVYAVLAVLERYRPDIVMIPVDTTPTGLMILVGLDPDSTVLSDNYREIVTEFRRPDPQPVPAAVLQRRFVQPPHRVLESGLLELAATGAVDSDLSGSLRTLATEKLGRAFASRVNP